ncbi:MAG: glycosyltransferase family 4 protein [Thermoanaerobaculia bacterium]|nr:MAG: glycosyltransferase family 4 protein [Thermoanaerobaculia bacterium]
MSANARVLVAHPGRQHSARLAWALDRVGMLAEYWVGVPLRGFLARPEPGLDLARERVVGVPWAPGLRKAFERLAPAHLGPWGDFLSSRLFDRWAARRLRSTRADLVVGYEVGCARLFEAAKAKGCRTLLDAAAVCEFDPARVWRPRQSPRLARRVAAVKRAELAAADHVFTASEMARESYVRAGFPSGRVVSVTLGADLGRFRPPEGRPTGPVRFLFVGSTVERKGIRELVSSMAQLVERGSKARLRVVGAILDAGAELARAGAPGVEFTGPMRGADLVAAYQAADLLVLPSWEDSFGLVVAEALACGTPVIVTDRVGAADHVQEGVTGWILPAGDAAALADRLSWCDANPERIRAMRPACAESASTLSWAAYEERVVAAVRGVMGDPSR